MQISDLIDIKVAIFSAANFLAVLFVLNRFLLSPLSKTIEARREREIQIQEDSKTLSYERENAQKHYQQKIAAAEKKANEIVLQGKQTAEEKAAELLSKTEQKVEREYSEFKQGLENERSQMVSDLRKEVIDLTLASTRKVLEKEINEKEDEAIISSYLNTLATQKQNG